MHFLLHKPVREQEGTDVRHRRGRGPQLCQRHDVFKGDVGLGAHVHHMDLLRRAMRAAAGGPPDDLHHDGVLGSTEGLHRLLMAGLGQLLPIHLRAGGKVWVFVCCMEALHAGGYYRNILSDRWS